MIKLTWIAALALAASVLWATAAFADCVGCHNNATVNYSSGSCGCNHCGSSCGCNTSCGCHRSCGCNSCGNSCGCKSNCGSNCGCNHCGNDGCGGGCGGCCKCCPRYPDQYPDPCRTGNPLSDWDRDGTSRHFA